MPNEAPISDRDKSQILSFDAAEEHEGLRIDRYLAEVLPDISRSYAANLIKEGAVSINDSQVKKPSTAVNAGDLIRIILPEASEIELEPENIPLDILYEDSDVLIINKPKGMVVHPAPGNFKGTLVNALLYHVKDLSGINGVLRPGIVHRIDRDTTGSLLICKNDLSHRAIAEQLKEHSIKRRYRTIVNGYIKADGSVDAPIGRSQRDRKKMAVTPEGRRAVTHYRVLNANESYSYLECELETGRTHQIRVHLSHIGHPVLNDPVYGRGKSIYRTEGQVLHAMTLGFIQPKTGEYIEVEAPLPGYFQELLIKIFGNVQAGTAHPAS